MGQNDPLSAKTAPQNRKKILYIISSSVTVELNRVGLEVYWSGDSPEFTRRPKFDSYTGV